MNFGNFLKVLMRFFARVPSPGPSSIILKYFGSPKFFHVEINQIAITSQNKRETLGAVI